MKSWQAAVRAILAVWAVSLAFGGMAARAQDSGGGQPQTHEILVMLRLSPDHHRPNASYSGPYGDQRTINLRRRDAEGIARRNGLSLAGEGWPMPLLGLDCYVMRVPPDKSVAAVVVQVSRDRQVAWSEPMGLYEARGSEGDPLFDVQPAAKLWSLADLHRVATGRGVTVAVIDSKVEVNHPDLAGQFVADEDFVSNRPSTPERHGTGVAGIIAAKAGNGIGIAGIAPDARLMALRACWQSAGGVSAPTFCDALSLAKAIHFAIDRRAGVINLSLAGPPNRLLALLIEIATSRNVSVVAAYEPVLPNGGFPASAPGVIAVTNDPLPAFPPGVYGAPGHDVPTTQPGGKWYLVTGSSYAAAHVSGLIALVRQARGSVRRPLLVASKPAGGALDACATLSRACGCTACPTRVALSAP